MTSVTCKGLAQLMTLTLLLPILASSIQAQQPGGCKPRRMRFERGESSVTVRGKLEPCKRRIYKLRARQGQKMAVLLLPEENDIVFWVRGVEPATGPLVLEGIHRNGMTDWSGELPFSGEYEISISRPPVSDSTRKRTLPYKLEVRVE